MRFINYLLLAVLLTGSTSVFGQGGIANMMLTPEQVRNFTRLAEQGNAEAQFNLGNSYSNGEGVPQDYQEAVKWYRRAAEQGVSMSMPQLEGVPWRIRSR